MLDLIASLEEDEDAIGLDSFRIYKEFLIVFYQEQLDEKLKKQFIKRLNKLKKDQNKSLENNLYHKELDYIDFAINNDKFKE